MKTTNCFLSLALAATTVSASFAQLQWKSCGSFPDRISVIYFYNSDLGFVSIGVPAGGTKLTPAIYRTADGGRTWTPAKTPTNTSYGVNEILMEDAFNGWAAGDNNNGRIWRTNDGGVSWNSACGTASGADHLGNSIRRTAEGLVVSDFLAGDIELSVDNGKTFRTVYRPPNRDYVLGMDFTDSLHGVAATTFRAYNSWAYTSDGGLNWHQSNYGTESWSLRAVKGTSTFFAIPEGLSNTNDYLSEVMRSDNYGQTWRKIRSLPFRGTSDIEIAGNTLYIQTGHGGCYDCKYPDGVGIYRSTDSGMTWNGLGGPDYWSDTRFAVIPSCYGTIIFCCDIHNNLFQAVDTSIATIKEPNGFRHTTIVPPVPMMISSCSSSLTNAIIHTEECYKLVIESEKIEGRDSAFFSLSKELFPVIIAGNYHTFGVTPRSQTDSGTFDAFLHILGYYDYVGLGTAKFDTLLPLHLIATGEHPQLTSDKNAIIFTSIDPCTFEPDETLTLRNTGCDTLRVISGPGLLIPQFTFEPVTLPFQLAPDESKTIRFHFRPDSARLFNDRALFRAEQRGRIQDLAIPIQGEKGKTIPQLEAANSRIFFQNISMCNPVKEGAITLMNTGCDTLQIVSLSDTLDPEFTIDTFPLPFTLAPKQSVQMISHFHPKKPGSYFGDITFTSRNDFDQKKISVMLMGSAESQGPVFTASNESINFPLRSTCEPPVDTAITITNTGCDSFTIISGPLMMPPEFTMDSVTFPIRLSPGEFIAFHFYFHPSGTADFTAHPMFITERYGLSKKIELLLEGKGVEGMAMLRTEPGAFVFSAMSICSPPDSLAGLIANSGCDTLIVSDIILPEGGNVSMSPLLLPLSVAPGDSLHYTIFFTPKLKGSFSGEITINARTAHGSENSFTNNIPVSALVGNGKRILRLFPSEIDLGAHSFCELKDTSIVIQNNGCDTLEINDAGISGSGFRFSSNNLPVSLSPGSSTTMRIVSELDTGGGKNNADAIISISSNADNVFASSHITEQYTYPEHHKIMLSGGIKNASPGDTILLELRTNSLLHGVQTLDLDLSYNTDLLGMFKVAGPNTATYSNGHLYVKGNPYIISDNGILAILSMGVYLTKEASTSIAISDIHLNTFDPSFEECRASASVSGDSPVFTSVYSCGDNTISDYLRNAKALHINSIYPNPAKDRLTLDLDVKERQDISIAIFDAFGKKQLTNHAQLTAGGHLVTLDLKMIPSGMFVVDISNAVSRGSVHFIKTQ